MRKAVHMSLCLSGVLKNWPKWKGTILRLDNTPAPKSDIQALYDEGVRVLPLSSEPCEGWSDVDGCPGHPVLVKPPGDRFKTAHIVREEPFTACGRVITADWKPTTGGGMDTCLKCKAALKAQETTDTTVKAPGPPKPLPASKKPPSADPFRAFAETIARTPCRCDAYVTCWRCVAKERLAENPEGQAKASTSRDTAVDSAARLARDVLGDMLESGKPPDRDCLREVYQALDQALYFAPEAGRIAGQE